MYKQSIGMEMREKEEVDTKENRRGRMPLSSEGTEVKFPCSISA
jgi:hypothetical protein